MLTDLSIPLGRRITQYLAIGLFSVMAVGMTTSLVRMSLELDVQQAVKVAAWRIASTTFIEKAHAAEPEAVKEVIKPRLILPAHGTNWGEEHAYNGVDIANSCGTPVVAARTGTVTDASFGWNGGYGNRVMIHHASGEKTHYAHLEDIFVEIGEKVSTGEQIGGIGNTGQSTGCHLHFEVHGGENPFIKD